MGVIDVDKLLSPVSADAPCGQNLEYDPEYMELDTMARGTPEQQVGNTIIPAEEPDWKAVRQRCTELLGRTKDLRVVLYLTLTLMKTAGLPGLRDGLALLRGVLQKYWDGVYPRLDPDDDNDPLERVNIIAQLSPAGDAGFNDPMRFKQRLREVPLVESPRLGRYSYRDIAVATGAMAPADPNAPKLEVSVIEAAFDDTPLEQLEGLAKAADEALENVKGIDKLLMEKAGPSRAPDLKDFEAALTEVKGHLQRHLLKRGSKEAMPGAAGGNERKSGGGQSAGGAPLTGDIRSGGDVIKALDKICDYYANYEPASPIPLLLRRAQRLVGKSFLDIIKDLSPEAISTIDKISGMDSTAAPPEQ